ncbi:MAG TPA: hypothetical protein VGL22_14670 [Terracidiphilus sp.]|jgi:hypothetical protein
MTNVEMHVEDIGPEPHNGHRVLDVTGIGHVRRRLLCLDCKEEFEEISSSPDRSWMNGTL